MAPNNNDGADTEPDWRAIALKQMGRSLGQWTRRDHFDGAFSGLGEKMASDELDADDITRVYKVTEEFFSEHHADFRLATNMPDDISALLEQAHRLLSHFTGAARALNDPDMDNDTELHRLERAFTAALAATRIVGGLIEERHTVTHDGVPPEYYEHANELSVTGAGKSPLSGTSPDYGRAQQLLTEMQQMVVDAAARADQEDTNE